MPNIEELKSNVILHGKIITFDDSLNRKIGRFASKMRSQYYKENRAASKPGADIFTGKAGEFILHWTLVRYFGFPSDCEPDLTVYEYWEKSWVPDLNYPHFPSFHCKTCNVETREFIRKSRPKEMGSWTFQNANTTGVGGHDSILNHPDSTEMVGYVYLKSTEPISGYVFATSPWNLVFPHLDNPVKRDLINIKKCVYSSKLWELSKK